MNLIKTKFCCSIVFLITVLSGCSSQQYVVTQQPQQIQIASIHLKIGETNINYVINTLGEPTYQNSSVDSTHYQYSTCALSEKFRKPVIIDLQLDSPNVPMLNKRLACVPYDQNTKYMLDMIFDENGNLTSVSMS
ncbi:hypothetical protein [Thorsellia anophelis]|uniref:Lipoprotein n=1 Tax=Thorsellia anophelis DSM 18579 TaxID=1123402 RepID=A0A1I0FUR6_9GAMM|nr:hypothetical protein [Thorsellia anophelis]SET62256.1 hypothetical protein SAMN02583745_02907 [Thorsellia anophelis DSM 18579]